TILLRGIALLWGSPPVNVSAMHIARLLLLMLMSAPPVFAAAPASTPADADADYARALDKRANDILKTLNLSDSAKAAKVHDILTARYRALRDWHDANDAKLKDKSVSAEEKDRVSASLKPSHDDFINKLSAELTPEQLET